MDKSVLIVIIFGNLRNLNHETFYQKCQFYSSYKEIFNQHIQGFIQNLLHSLILYFFQIYQFYHEKTKYLFISNMPSSSKSKKRASENIEVPSNKRQNTENICENLIWVDLSNKTSWIWKYFKLATDGKTYCFHNETIDDVEETCDFSCAYNSQTSSMNYHLNTIHKVYEKKKQYI
jgi:hypothetical protein